MVGAGVDDLASVAVVVGKRVAFEVDLTTVGVGETINEQPATITMLRNIIDKIPTTLIQFDEKDFTTCLP